MTSAVRRHLREGVLTCRDRGSDKTTPPNSSILPPWMTVSWENFFQGTGQHPKSRLYCETSRHVGIGNPSGSSQLDHRQSRSAIYNEKGFLWLVDSNSSRHYTFLGSRNCFLQLHSLLQPNCCGIWLELCSYILRHIAPEHGNRDCRPHCGLLD